MEKNVINSEVKF